MWLQLHLRCNSLCAALSLCAPFLCVVFLSVCSFSLYALSLCVVFLSVCSFSLYALSLCVCVPAQGLVHTSTSAHDILTTAFGTCHKPLPAPLSSMFTTAPVHGLADLSTSVQGLPHISKAASFCLGYNNMSNAVSSSACPTDVSGCHPAILEGGYGAREHAELTSKSCWPSATLLGSVSDSQV